MWKKDRAYPNFDLGAGRQKWHGFVQQGGLPYAQPQSHCSLTGLVSPGQEMMGVTLPNMAATASSKRNRFQSEGTADG